MLQGLGYLRKRDAYYLHFTGSCCTSIAGIATHSYTMTKYEILGIARDLAAEVGQPPVYGMVTGIGNGERRRRLTGEEVEAAEASLSQMGNLKGKVLKAECVASADSIWLVIEANCVSGLNLGLDGGFLSILHTHNIYIYMERLDLSGLNLGLDGGFSVVNPTIIKPAVSDTAVKEALRRGPRSGQSHPKPISYLWVGVHC